MRVLGWVGRLWTGVLLVIVLGSGVLLGLRLLLPLPFLSTRPALLESTPATGARNVAPRAPLTLRFSAPMNPASVERSLQIEPSAPVALEWSADRTTLLIAPVSSLQPDTTYTLTVGADAHSRMFRPIDGPASLTFHTAQAPAVVMALPADGAREVPLDSPISVSFSRPMVTTATVLLPLDAPLLRFEPPLDGATTWIDPATALFRPAAPLEPGTRYQAMLAAGLRDSQGGELGESFSWSFSTPAPAVLDARPAAGDRRVAPRAPLVLHLSQPFDLDQLRVALAISPTVTGAFAAARLPDASQVITFTPEAGWQADTPYIVELAPGLRPIRGNLALERGARWSFRTAPQPLVVGRFPGEGQVLPSGQDIRLIFNTVFDPEALRAAIRFSPPVENVRVSATTTEARIEANLAAATVYTMTLPADLADRDGVPLGRSYQIRVLTAPAAPALLVPDAAGHVVRAAPGANGLLVRRTNLSSLVVDMYALDEPTVVRLLGFSESEWRVFSPERYGQLLGRSWTVTFDDALNVATESRLELALAAGQPLAPGAYYVRLRSPEQQRADLLLLVGRARLLVQESGLEAVVWATDLISGTTVDGLPVALYRDGALVQQGQTGPDGLWRAALPPGSRRPLIAVSAADGAAAVVAPAPDARQSPAYRALLLTDQTAYQPGATVAVAGFVRAVAGQSTALPPSGLQGALTARRNGAAARVFEGPIAIGQTGVISAGFTLPLDAAPGDYTLALVVGGTAFTQQFQVRPARGDGPLLEVGPPARDQNGAVTAPLSLATSDGLPLAGAVLTWTVTAAPARLPQIDGFTFDDDGRVQDQVFAWSGAGRTDAAGQLTIALTDTVAADHPLRYQVHARAAPSGGPSVDRAAAAVIAPAQLLVGLRLGSPLGSLGQTHEVEVITTDGAGAPASGVPVRLEVLRQTWTDAALPQERRVLARALTTGADGRASVQLALPQGGEYRVRAFVDDDQGRRASSAATLWVAENGFASWRTLAQGGPALIADRDVYRPGDTARLLLTAPFEAGTALVTVRRGDALVAIAQPFRAGDLLAVPIAADDLPLLPVSITLVERRAAGQAGAVFATSTTLRVASEARELTVALAADAANYAPGATATLTITTVDAQGQGVPADVILGIVAGSLAPPHDIGASFEPTAPPIASSFAGAPPAAGQPARAAPAVLDSTPGETIGWEPALQTSTTGVLTVALRLPGTPSELQALAWAAGGPAAFGQAQRTLSVTQPLALALEAGPALRAGDEFELRARLRNTTPVEQLARVSLAATGASLPGDNRAQEVVLAPGQERTIGWPVVVENGVRASFEVRAAVDGGPPVVASVERHVLPPAAVEVVAGGALFSGQISQTLRLAPGARDGWGALEVELAPSTQALERATIEALAGVPARSALDHAALLLLSAPITDTHTLARAAVAELAAAQAGGGWGWWPGDAPEPFVTAAVLEGLAAARRAGLNVPDGLVEPGLDALEATVRDNAAPTALRAQALYVASLFGPVSPADAAALAADPSRLSAEALAYLLLAQPPDDGPQTALATALAGGVQRAGDLAFWAPDGDVPYSTSVSATALAALALEQAGADQELLAAARRALAAQRAPGGWQNGFEGAYALVALRGAALRAPGGRYTVSLNNTLLIDEPAGGPITTTWRVVLPLGRLAEANSLVAAGGDAFLSYRLTTLASPVPRQTMHMLREYLDPLTGRPVSLDSLQVGQPVQVRLTVVPSGPTRFLTIREPLPGGLVLADVGTGDFARAARHGDRLVLTSASLPHQIHQHSYTLRAVAPGRYAAPAATAQIPGGVTLGRSNAATIRIAP